MKTIIKYVTIGFVVSAMCGCATSPYMIDRQRDALDIITFTVGEGYGATTRVGPIHAGIYSGADRWGLKGGETIWNYSDTDENQ